MNKVNVEAAIEFIQVRCNLYHIPPAFLVISLINYNCNWIQSIAWNEYVFLIAHLWHVCLFILYCGDVTFCAPLRPDAKKILKTQLVLQVEYYETTCIQRRRNDFNIAGANILWE